MLILWLFQLIRHHKSNILMGEVKTACYIIYILQIFNRVPPIFRTLDRFPSLHANLNNHKGAWDSCAAQIGQWRMGSELCNKNDLPFMIICT